MLALRLYRMEVAGFSVVALELRSWAEKEMVQLSKAH